MIGRILRWTLLALLGLVLLVALALAWLIGTNSGARFLVSQATALEPRLQLEITQGSLWRGLEVKNLRWQAEGITVAVSQAEFAWRPDCLLDALVCIDRVATDGIRVEVQPSNEPAPPPEEGSAMGRVSLPVAIRLQTLKVTDVQVTVAETRVSLDLLELSASFEEQRLKLPNLRVDGLDLTVAETSGDAQSGSEASPQPAAEASSADSQTASSDSVGVLVPIDVELGKLDVTDVNVKAPGTDVALNSLQAEASLNQERLAVPLFHIDGLQVTLPAPPEQPASAPPPDAAPSESPDSGPIHVQLPDIELPLDVALEDFAVTDIVIAQGESRWPVERVALAAGVAGPEVSLDKLQVAAPQGKLSASGQVALEGDWPLQLKLQAQAPALIEQGPLSLDTSLDGSLAALEINADVAGVVTAKLGGQVQVTKPKLPFDLTLTTPRAGWPLDTGAMARAEKLRAQLAGDLEGYRITLNTKLRGEQVPAGDWSLKAQGDLRSLRLEELVARTLDGRLRVTGKTRWGEQTSWQAKLTLENINPGVLRPEIPGNLSGSLSTEGAVVDDGWRMTLEIPAIEGSLRDYPLSLQGGAKHTADDTWIFDDIRLNSGPNSVRVGGRLAQEWDAQVELDLPRLATFWDGLSGAVDGGVQLTGPVAQPTVNGDMRARQVAYQDFSVQSVELTASVADALREQSRIVLDANGLNNADTDLGNIELTFDGALPDHDLRIDAEGGPVGVGLLLAGSFDIDSGDYEGNLSDGGLALPDGDWRQQQAAPVRWDASAQRARVGDHCWAKSDGASFCLPKPLEAGPAFVDGEMTLSDYDLASLGPLLPEAISLQAVIDARAAVQWQGGDQRPRVQARVETQGGEVRLAREDGEEPLVLSYRQILLEADVDDQSAQAVLTLDTQRLGNGRTVVNVDPWADPRALSGEVRLKGLDVAVAQPFVPQLRELDGQIGVDGQLGGTLQEPTFNGTLNLVDGLVAIQNLPIPISDIQLEARIQGTEAELEGGFAMGEGNADVGGTLGWGDGVRGLVALAGRNLRVAYPPMVQLDVSPALTVAVRPDEIAVNGRVAIPSGRIEVKELPASAVSVSDDVVLVDPEGKKQAEAKQAKGPTLNTNIYLVLGDDVRFSGFGAEGRLEGALQLDQIGTDSAQANGEVRVEDGTFEGYGQDLTIRRGSFVFAGPLSEPQLDIEAVRQVENVVAGLRVTGDPTQPQVSLFSEPPMPEEDILTYILTGSPPGSGSASEEELAAQAALSLGVLGGRGVGSAVADTLGVKDFKLDTEGSGEESQVAVSGYIAPNLLVSYGVGVFEPNNTLTLRYYLTQQLYLEAVSGLESALDVFYSFDF